MKKKKKNATLMKKEKENQFYFHPFWICKIIISILN